MNIILGGKYGLVNDGKKVYKTIIRYMYLEKDEKAMTNEYFSMLCLFDDYYMVSNYIDVNGTSKLKFGVIKISRDKNGEVIPKEEKIVIPLVYDHIRYGNSKTLLVLENKKYKYIEFDSTSKDYCRDIVPAVLDKASVFDEKYNGYAECKYQGEVRYLSRFMKPVLNLELDMLYKEEQFGNKKVSNGKILVLNKNKK